MVAGQAFGQAKKYKNVFTGPNLEYLEFKDDSTLVTTLNGDWDTTAFLIRSDSLLIKKEHWTTDQDGDHHWVEWLPFKLLSRNTDTFRLLIAPRRLSKSNAREDTLILVCLETLKEPILNFTFFNVTAVSPWHGTIDISIDSVGRLVYFRKIRNPSDTGGKTDNRVTTRILTKQEFDKFKDRLSYSLLFKLHRFRGGCDAMDAGMTSLEIIYNNKKVISKGCTLQWPQSVLFKNVYDLAIKKANRSESKPTSIK